MAEKKPKEYKHSLEIDMWGVKGTLNYTTSTHDKHLRVYLTSLVVKNTREWEEEGEQSYQVSYSVTLGGQSFWSHGASWENGATTLAKIALSKNMARADAADTVQIRMTATHGGTVKVKTETLKIAALADKYVTPTRAVTGLTLERKEDRFTAKWKVPSAATKSGAADRFTGIHIRWTLMKSGKDIVDKDNTGNESATSNSQTYGEFKRGLSRSSFFPMGNPPGPTVQGVKVAVRGYHKRADGKTVKYGPWAGPVAYEFAKPRKPSVEWSYDQSTSKATVTVKTDEGKDDHERYDTHVSVAKSGSYIDSLGPLVDGGTRSTEWSKTFDLSRDLNALSPGDYVTLKCAAKARGIAGASDSVASSCTVGMPVAAAISKVECDKKGAGGRVKVAVKVGKVTKSVQLQRRHGADGNWEDVSGAVDNKDCKALYDAYQDASPVAGEHIYYRVKSTCEQFTVYGAAKRADCLYTAVPPVECKATLTAPVVKPSSDGQRASVKMGWKDSTDNHGLELSWSHDPDAWKSGSGPSTETYARGQKSGSETVTVTGLDADRPCWVKYRRYRDKGDERYFSAYSSAVKFGGDSASNDKCGVAAARSSSDGTSIDVVVGYTEDSANDGTELQWSTDEGAWSKSNGDISTAEYTAAGGSSNYKSWDKIVTLTVTGLQPDTTYYFKARRYNDTGTRTYTKEQKDPYPITTRSIGDSKFDVFRITPDPSGRIAEVLITAEDYPSKTGFELTWADDNRKFRSNESVSSIESTELYSGHATYIDPRRPYLFRCYLYGLEPGTKYYLMVRRFSDAGSTRDYTARHGWFDFKTPRVDEDSATNDRCGIVSASVDNSGTGATVVVGWTEDNVNDGTELSWSADSGAWQSNEGPQTMQATWEDAKSQSTSWKKTQTIYLRGLELGTNYYVKARRYLSSDSSFSPYCKAVSIRTPSDKGDPDVRCGIVSLEAIDGDTAKVVVGWSGDRTGCEVSWAPDVNAWESNDGPQAKEFDWADEFNQSGFKTTDTAVNASKTYYTRSGSAGAYRYAKVASPTAAGLPNYYELAWAQTGALYVNGLEEGVTQYVKARSYHEGDGDRTWSGYSEAMSVTPYAAPLSVALSAPSAIARGESIEAYWTVESEMPQKEWHAHIVNQPNKSIGDGDGSLCHASIPPERYGSAASIEFYVEAGCGGGLTRSNNAIVGIADKPTLEAACPATLTAQPATFWAYTNDPSATLLATCCSRGVTFSGPDGNRDQLAGDTVWTGDAMAAWVATTWGSTLLYQQLSDAVTAAQTALADAQDAFDALIEGTGYSEAKATLDAAQEALDALPADAPEADVEAATQARDDAQAALDAITSQIDGFADALTARDNAATALSDAQAALAAHPSDGETYQSVCAIPEGTDFIDGGTYDIAVQAVEQVAGLRSEAVSCSFAVEWAHQAPEPSEEVAITVDHESRSVEITLPQPEGWATGDTYEVHRVTQTSHVLALGGVEAGTTVVDPYAPFGETHYRIATRTADGDVAFDDFDYELDVRLLRFDWGTDSVELPYNVEVSDAYEKSFEARDHVDGTVNGYYDRAVHRTGTYNAAVRKADDATIEALRKLGEHPGAVFCRLASGGAFQCNADLGGLEYSYASAAAGVSFPITEMRLTQQFMAHVKREGE